MAVSARSAKDLLQSDSVIAVDMRADGRGLAGTFVYQGDRLATGWHTHDLHQLEYAIQGVVEVETDAGHYLLPPRQAAWLPAGLAHQTTINVAVESISVFFDTTIVPTAGDRARIVAVVPLLREMILHATRWPIGRSAPDKVADQFLRTLADVVAEALDHEMPLHLPTSRDPLLAAAMSYTKEHLDEVSIGDVSRAVGVSERTLRRVFSASVGMPWRKYLLQARILRAMALLAEPGRSVLQAATDVGFDSVSAFTRTFFQHCGQTPSAYRRQVGSRPPAP